MSWRSWLPWHRSKPAPVSPFGPDDVKRAEGALAELHEITMIALRTELLLREHGRQFQEHWRQTEHDLEEHRRLTEHDGHGADGTP
jgi:hypothetical protein